MIPFIQESRLRNGIRLMLVERTSLPLMHLSFLFRSGATADPAGKAGLATLAADALDAGTPSRSLAEIAETFDFAGAYYQSGVTHDGTVVTLSSLTSHLDRMTAVIADIIRNASYPAAEVERLRNQRLTSFLQAKDRPARIANTVFARTVFGADHPYGPEADGDERSLHAISHSDVAGFKATHYNPEQLLVIGVGNLSMVALEHLVGGLFGDWTVPGVRVIVPAPAVPTRTPCTLLVDRPGAVQSEIRLGGIALRRTSPEHHAALILNRVLGGQFSSRLNANLREKRGLTYGVWSSFQASRWEGPFVAGGAFHTEKTDEAVRELILEMKRIRESGITEEEHSFAVESLAGSYALAFETSGQVAQALQVRELCSMPADSFTTHLPKLRAVTQEDIRRVAEAFLDPATMTTVVVGDASRVRGPLEQVMDGPVILTSAEGEPVTPPSS